MREDVKRGRIWGGCGFPDTYAWKRKKKGRDVKGAKDVKLLIGLVCEGRRKRMQGRNLAEKVNPKG